MVEDKAGGLKLGMPPESVPMIIYGTPFFIAPERLRGSPGDFRADIFSIGALWYSMLTGEALADPRNADPVTIAQRLDLPPALRAVLLGALEIHIRRHHSAASMAGAIHQALEDTRGRRQRMRRLGALTPLLSLLAIPVWFALQTAPSEQACPDLPRITNLPAATCLEPQAIVATPLAHETQVIEDLAPLAIAAPLDSEPDRPSRRVALTETTYASTQTLNETATRPPTPASPPRFNLRRALAKCKPHPTAQIEIAIIPGERVQIDGEHPTGELGRCVEDVLAAHPPQRAETIEL